MTDSDPVNPFAAPKQQTVSSDPVINDPIRYEATPTINDLNSALRPTAAILSSVVLLSLMLFIFVMSSIAIFFDGVEDASQLLVLFGTILFGGLTSLHLFTKLFAAKLHLRSNPNATAPLTGELTSEGLLLSSNNSIAWLSHRGLVSCNQLNRQLVLCHDPRGISLRILPIRGFSHPDRATRFLEFQADEIAEPLDMLTPLTGPSMVGDQPADAIAFSGLLKVGDQNSSPLIMIQKRNAKLKLIAILAFNAIVLPALFLVFDWQVALIIGGGVLTLDFFAVRNIFRPAQIAYDPELALIAIQGWINATEIALLHNVAQSRTQWQEIKSLSANEDCIWLECYGGKNLFVLLPRRFFADEARWLAAVDIVASHSTK